VPTGETTEAPQAAPDGATDQLTTDLRVATMLLGRRLRAESRSAAGLSEPQFCVMAALVQHGPLSPSRLAELENVQPPSMTRTVASLEALGLVERATHPTDGRQVVVTLTAEAEDQLTAWRQRRDEWLRQRLEELSPEDRAVLAEAASVIMRVVGR